MLNLVQSAKPNGKPSPEQILHAQLQQQAQQLSQLAGIVCSLLKENHEGRAFIKMSSLGELANWKVSFQALPELGTMRLQLHTPDGQSFIATAERPEEKPVTLSENPIQQTSTAETIAEASPSSPCPSGWHKDGIGLRCPDCGSIERVSA